MTTEDDRRSGNLDEVLGTARGAHRGGRRDRAQRRGVRPALHAAEHLRLPSGLQRRQPRRRGRSRTRRPRAPASSPATVSISRQSSLHDRIVGAGLSATAVAGRAHPRSRSSGRTSTLGAMPLTAAESQQAMFSPLRSFLRLAGFAYIVVALLILLRRPNRMTWGLFLYLVSATNVTLYRFPDWLFADRAVRIRPPRRRRADRPGDFRGALSRRSIRPAGASGSIVSRFRSARSS